MKQFISFQRNSQEVDVNTEFRHYKYAVAEHSPIQLSNGKWLHTYRCTKYDDYSPYDIDVESETTYREMYY